MREHSHRFDAVIVAPNTAIDSYYLLSGLDLGRPNRANRVIHTAGGKGINMARAMLNLGGRGLCLGFVGGRAGDFVMAEMRREGISHDMEPVQEETRRCCTLHMGGAGDVTVLLDPGPPVGSEIGERLKARVRDHLEDAPYLVLIGSLPPGMPSDYYAKLIDLAKQADTKVCLDCSGESLRLAAESGPWMIKVNRNELSLAFDVDPRSCDWQVSRNIYRSLRSKGVEVLVVTDGKQGADVFSPDGSPFHVATTVKRWVSTAGAGDTFFAAVLLGMGRGDRLDAASRSASAAAAANLQQIGCGVLEMSDYAGYLEQTRSVSWEPNDA